MAILTEKEIEVIQGLEQLEESTPDNFLFQFEMLLLESGLMKPWMCAYNPCFEYRVM